MGAAVRWVARVAAKTVPDPREFAVQAECQNVRASLGAMAATGAGAQTMGAFLAGDACGRDGVLRYLEECLPNEPPALAVPLLDGIASVDPALAQAGLKAWGMAPVSNFGDPGARREVDLTGRPWVTSLPDGFTVDGILTLDGLPGLTELPPGLTGPSVSAKDCLNLLKVGPGIEIFSRLELDGCRNLTALPDGLVAPSLDLNLGHTGLTRLPAGLAVFQLNLEGCSGLTALPSDLAVNGVLVLDAGCPLFHMEDDELRQMAPGVCRIDRKVVYGQGWCSKGIALRLPLSDELRDFLNAMEATGMPEGDALGLAALTHGRDAVAPLVEGVLGGQDLPDAFDIAFLDGIAGSDGELAQLGLVAWGRADRWHEDLDLSSRSWITCWPFGLKAGGSLNLSDCVNLTRLPEGLGVINHLDLTGCAALTALPDDLRVGADLCLEGCCRLTDLPNGLKVGRPDSDFEYDGEGYYEHGGFLRLKGCPLAALSDDVIRAKVTTLLGGIVRD
jgi:hypothetical protein